MRFALLQKDRWDPSDTVLLLEDDYLFRPGWPKVLEEGFQHGDYVSLYDHRDKYVPGCGACRLSFSDSCHWRTAMSTTNTFATKYSTLLEDIPIHCRFAEAGVHQGHHQDHEKFLALYREKRRRLVTSVPGFATHCEADLLSPAFDWSTLVS